MTYANYANLNTLEEVSFIGGTTFYLDFKLKDSAGSYINLVGKTFTWKMSPYGTKSVTTLSKTGVSLVSDDYTVRITLSPSDTENLSGKYIQQISFVSEDVTNAEWEFIHEQELTISVQNITLGFNQPAFPRYITVQGDNSGIIGKSVTVTGTDEDDASVNETISLSGTTRVSGEQMFKTITQIDYPTYVSSGDTITVGGGSYVTSATYIPAQGIIIISPKIGG